MPDPTSPSTFAANLKRTMDALNLSRVAMARELGVDKSVIGRWLSGATQPTGHNLTRLTDIARRHSPGATSDFWARPLPGPEQATQPPPPRPDGFRLVGLQMPRVPTLESPYVGLWAGFMQSVRNRGIIVLCTLNIWPEGDGLRCRFTEGRFWGDGPALAGSGRLHCFWEMAPAYDRICAMLFNGVFARDQIVMDGLVLSAAGEATGTPGAIPMLLFRIGDEGTYAVLGGLEGVRTTLADLNAARTPSSGDPFTPFLDLAPRLVLELLFQRVGAPRDDGTWDHMLRMPAARANTALLAAGPDEVSAAWRVRTALRDLLGLSGTTA